AAALEAEVDDYLVAHAAERDEGGRRLVVRNGHARQPQVLTAPGGVQARPAGGRPPPRPGHRPADPLSLDDPAALVPQEPQGGRGAAAVVPARAVDPGDRAARRGACC